MNDIGGDFYSSDQSPTTPGPGSSPAKDSNVRPHGDMLKMMNPTPNGYSSVQNHKPKPETPDAVHHESKHSSDHVKKKDHDDSKHKSSSHSKSKDSSKDSSKKEGHDRHKEKKHKSSHKDGSKESSHKHSDASKHSSEKKEDKSKSESSSKELNNSAEKPKTDNFKENEKVKDSSSKEHKEKHKEHKEKHKDKHRDKEHKEKHKDKSKSSGDKEKSDKPKENSEKKEKDKSSEKHKDKHKEKHKDKKDKSSKEKHGVATVKTETLSYDKSPTEKLYIKEEITAEEDSFSLLGFSSRKASINASKSIKREAEDSDDEPLSGKGIEKKAKPEKKKKKAASDDDEYEMEERSKKKRKADSDDEDDNDYGSKKQPVKKIKKEVKKEIKKEIKQEKKPKMKVEPVITASPTKRKKKGAEEEQEVWKWWEEEKLEGGAKWRTLQHNGPVFAPAYERVPKTVRFYYDGKAMELSEITEEVAGFYGRMLDHEYTSKDVFNTNFYKDWRKVMTPKEREIIKDLKKCNFKEFDVYYKMKSEERKSMTKEQKAVIKKENEELTAEYGFCIIDGHKQKIGNFRIEPPGLFRGRGEHPKMGMLKRRVEAEDISINIGKEANIPSAPPGHRWKEVRHDTTVSWLASWNENILGSTKYIMLNPSSKLKGEKDWQKYETARKLKAHAGRIREEYTRDFKSKEMKVRQRAVALYFIDKLALRAGNEKDEDTADTVGCCSIRVEHITLDEEKDGKEYVVSFDFLGKDSIRYENSVPVDKKVFKNVKLFMENKQPGDDLFDRLNTTILNKYLNDLMEGLTAKVFRTYNASKTLQEQLDLLTEESMSIPEKVLAYNRANRAVAILCNHQRAVPKTFSKSMENLKQKIDEKVGQIKDFKKEFKQLKQAGGKDKVLFDKKKKRLAQLEEQLQKLEVQATDKEENKQIALGTSKLNYLDPRISVAWCKKWSVPIEKVYNRTQRDKFRWAIEMAGPEYKF